MDDKDGTYCVLDSYPIYGHALLEAQLIAAEWSGLTLHDEVASA